MSKKTYLQSRHRYAIRDCLRRINDVLPNIQANTNTEHSTIIALEVCQATLLELLNNHNIRKDW